MSDLFGVVGRELLDSLAVPEPWRGNVDASLLLIDEIDREIATLTPELKRLGAQHRYMPMLMTAPGVGWLVGFPIATKIGGAAAALAIAAKASGVVSCFGSTGCMERYWVDRRSIRPGSSRCASSAFNRRMRFSSWSI